MSKVYTWLIGILTLGFSVLYSIIQKQRADAAEKEADEYQARLTNIDKQIDAGKKRRKKADEAIKDVKPGNTIADINKRMRNYRDGKVH